MIDLSIHQDLGRLRLLHRFTHRQRPGRGFWQITRRHHMGHHPCSHVSIRRVRRLGNCERSLGPKMAFYCEQLALYCAGIGEQPG